MRRPEEKHLPILQSLETNLAMLYQVEPTLTDYDVNEAYDALLRIYKAQTTGRGKPEIKLKGRSEAVYKQLSGVAEMLLAKPDMLIVPEKGEENLLEISAEEMLACLKRLQSSLKLWTKEGGRQGYLNYLSQFV
jgi:hypothetical protein